MIEDRTIKGKTDNKIKTQMKIKNKDALISFVIFLQNGSQVKSRNH